MKKASRVLALMLVVVSIAVAVQAQEEEPTGKLMVVWTSGDPDVADKVCQGSRHPGPDFLIFESRGFLRNFVV